MSLTGCLDALVLIADPNSAMALFPVYHVWWKNTSLNANKKHQPVQKLPKPSQYEINMSHCRARGRFIKGFVTRAVFVDDLIIVVTMQAHAHAL